MSSHFELSPDDYERHRDGHMQRRRRDIVSATLRSNSRAGTTVVELGCGPGALVAVLAEKWPALRFLGVDVEARMIEHARTSHKAPNLAYRVVDLEAEPMGVLADVVFSVDLVHHVHELDFFLANVRRTLRSGGIWLVIEPNVFHPYVLVSQERMRRRGLDEDHFRPWRFEGTLRRAGFVVDRRRTAFLVPGWVDHVPAIVQRLELILESVPVLGGSIVYQLRAA